MADIEAIVASPYELIKATPLGRQTADQGEAFAYAARLLVASVHGLVNKLGSCPASELEHLRDAMAAINKASELLDSVAVAARLEQVENLAEAIS